MENWKKAGLDKERAKAFAKGFQSNPLVNAYKRLVGQDDEAKKKKQQEQEDES